MARTDPQIVVRVPAALHARIRELSVVNRRSMNGEVVYQLEQVLGRAANLPEELDRTPGSRSA